MTTNDISAVTKNKNKKPNFYWRGVSVVRNICYSYRGPKFKPEGPC